MTRMDEGACESNARPRTADIGRDADATLVVGGCTGAAQMLGGYGRTLPDGSIEGATLRGRLAPPVVVDVRYAPFDVYIGRRSNRAKDARCHNCSVWCNPFRVDGPASVVGPRAQAVAQFEELMRVRLDVGGKNGLDWPWAPELWRGQLLLLAGQRLGCWCKGRRGRGDCHGDVLVKLWHELVAEGRRR